MVPDSGKVRNRAARTRLYGWIKLRDNLPFMSCCSVRPPQLGNVFFEKCQRVDRFCQSATITLRPRYAERPRGRAVGMVGVAMTNQGVLPPRVFCLRPRAFCGAVNPSVEAPLVHLALLCLPEAVAINEMLTDDTHARPPLA